MMTLRLSNVDWNAAIAAIDTPGKHASGQLLPEHLAQALSLSALYTSDFQTASARIKKASRLEPFSPLHELRKALLLSRFGDLGRATVALDHLKQALPETPLVDYVRGLLALRAGRPEQARAIAKTLETVHPNFIYGKFLKAEAQVVLSAKPSAIEKHLLSLPVGPQYESLWADILIKMAFLHSKDGPAQALKHLDKKIRAGSPANTAVRRAIAWASASIEEIDVLLANEISGSRAEELILSCLVERLELKEDNPGAVKAIAALRRQHPERAVLKRIQNAFVTRLAMERSGADDHEHALRLVERCLREQPHDQVYHQNRAALFTLLRESGPYHEAWATLNQHQYRLLLLGVLDQFTITQVAMSHRLFAQQARGIGQIGSGSRLYEGIFRQMLNDEPGELKRVRVNQDEIAADRDLLRQWLHHSRAELIFRHCLLGDNPYRLFLHPVDRDEAISRAEGLATSAESLVTLVPEEGTLLASALSTRWLHDAETIRTNYNTAQEEEDDEVRQLQLQHLELLGDLALFCKQWQPDFQQLALAEELLGFIRSERDFFDEKVLFRLERQSDVETPFPLLVLSDHIRRVTGIERDGSLTSEQRSTAIDSLMAELLLRMASSAYNMDTLSQKERVNRAMSLIKRARALNPANAVIEYEAARFLVIGEFYEEARAALQRFHRLVEPDEHELLSAAEQLEQILREKRKEDAPHKRLELDFEPNAAPAGREFRIAELERELDCSPASWRLYEEMVSELAKAARFDDAIVWADRSVAHCLSRALQLNARALAIEARGLKTLAQENPMAAHLYAVGAHEPARKAIESLGAGQPDYTVLFLLGRCQLAAGCPDEAQEAFEKAERLCERQLHRTVLRHLNSNIDNAYLSVARSSVNAALQDDSVEEAVAEAAAVFTRLQEPAAWLVDFARVFYNAALACLSVARPPLTVPRIAIETVWQARLNTALLSDDDVERALAIVKLAVEVHPPSLVPAQALGERLQTLKRQIALTDSLNQAGRLLTSRRFEDLLTLFEQLDPTIVCEPRFVRMRVLALLGLNRFVEADTLVKEAGESVISELRGFIADYPSLVFRQRLAIAHRFLREAKIDEAAEVLRSATPTTARETADLAYCRAYGLTMHAYQLRRQERADEARARFLQAMDLLEPNLSEAGSNEQSHLIELYDRLEKDLEAYDRT
jgi:tetratricopeptide (TPR) repeat protein